MNDKPHFLQKSQSRLAHDFNTVLDDAQELLRQATGEAGKGYADARERLQQSVETARHGVEAMEVAVLDGARQTVRSTDSQMRRHPWAGIGAGAAAGLLLGLLISRG